MHELKTRLLAILSYIITKKCNKTPEKTQPHLDPLSVSLVTFCTYDCFMKDLVLAPQQQNQMEVILMNNLEQYTDLDYYQILGVDRNANTQQFCLRYKDIALNHHPSLQHNNPNQAYRIFSQAAEAFDVLFDSQKKRIYDAHGEQYLKEGVLKNPELIGKYKFTTDPEEVFEKFFGSRNVFEHLLEADDAGQSHPIFKAQYPSLNEGHKVANLVVPVKCTLTELFNGCTKEVTYDKTVLTADGKNTEVVKENRKLTISPGDCGKAPLAYPGQGNCEPGYKQSVLVFKIVEINEKNFKREGNDLIYTAQISLMDALDSKSITVKQLNGELINLHFDQIISPQTRRILENRGMPVKSKPGQRGNLIVKFDIQFPDELAYQKKQRVIKLLSQ